MVRVSCTTKFHSFALAEQLFKHGLLAKFHTLYFSKANGIYRNFHRRVDNEAIPTSHVETSPFFLPIFYLWKDNFKRCDAFDKLIAKRIQKDNDMYSVFIGWSGLSLHTARAAKQQGKVIIIERGSSHIQFQNELLIEEYARFGIKFSIDNRFIEKELEEYDLADYVSIPSTFVLKSFLQNRISADKLIKNPYGCSPFFSNKSTDVKQHKFRILYLGSVTIRKGLVYLFEAILALQKVVPATSVEFWIVGSIDNEMKDTFCKYFQPNWKYFGHVNHYDLPRILSDCDVAVQPSLEEGLSMVIPQLLSCRVPVIATTNTGGEDVIVEGVNGFIVPIRDALCIKDRLLFLFDNPIILGEMKHNCTSAKNNDLSWDGYGNRYASFLRNINPTKSNQE